jgi:hypothetical protein
MEVARYSSRWLAFWLGSWRGFGLEITKRIYESFCEILLIIFEAGLFGLKAFHPHVLDLELEHSAGDAGQVYIKIPLHQ